MANKQYISDLFAKYEDDMQQEIRTKNVLEVHHQLIMIIDEFNKELSEEQQKKLQEILELEHSYGALESEQIFIYAFSLAVKLILASVSDNKGI